MDKSLIFSISSFITAVIASLITLTVNKALDYYKEKHIHDRELHYLAIKLMFLFDGYASNCLETLLEHEENITVCSIDFYDPDALYKGQSLKIPDAPKLPNEAGYQLLNHKTLISVLNFEQEIKMKHRTISSVGKVCDDEVIVEERTKCILLIGIKAAAIAKEIREKYKLPTTENSYRNQKVSEYLNEKLKNILEAEKLTIESEE